MEIYNREIDFLEQNAFFFVDFYKMKNYCNI